MLLYISILIAILSVILTLYNWKINKTALYLSFLFLIFSTCSLAHYFTFYGKSAFWLAIFFSHFSPLWLLLGPLLYFYVRGTLLDRQGLSWSDGWHFIPAVIHFVNVFPYLREPFAYKLQLAESIINNLEVVRKLSLNLLYSINFSFIERPVLLFVYVLFSLRILLGHRPSKLKNSTIPFKQHRITYYWLMLLLTTVLIIAVNFFLLSISLISQVDAITGASVNLPTHYIAGIALFTMVGSLLLFPQILYGIPTYLNINPEAEQTLTYYNIKTISPLPNNAIENNSEDPFIKLAASITNYLENEKPYLNNKFSFTDLSIALKAPQHHLLYCFNNILKIKFTDLRTNLRIDYAKEILINGEAEKLSMDGISNKVGFSSRSTFYTAFKSATGFTPKEFILNLKSMQTS